MVGYFKNSEIIKNKRKDDFVFDCPLLGCRQELKMDATEGFLSKNYLRINGENYSNLFNL